MEASVFWLAFTFGLHIVMVNLGIAFSVIVPGVKWISDKRGDPELMRLARTLIKFYAATYGIAGVFGTAYTVFLLSFYPHFLGLAGNITMIPFGLSILFIAVNFISLAAYWYGWDRWSSSTHLGIGILMAVSAVLIPFGFRAVFAFLNTPAGLHFTATETTLVPRLSVAEALGNPTFLPLYLKSIVGAITAGLMVIIAVYAYRYHKPLSSGDKNLSLRVLKTTTPYAIIGLIIMAFLGLWYSISLENVPYKFNNIFGGLGFKQAGVGVSMNLTWLFLLKMVFVAIQAVAVVYVYYVLKKKGSMLPKRVSSAAIIGAASALATIITGEYLNAFSQYPYFVAQLGNPAFVQAVPEPLRGTLAQILSLKNYNPLATTHFVMALTSVFIGGLLIAVAIFIYMLLTPEKGEGYPE